MPAQVSMDTGDAAQMNDCGMPQFANYSLHMSVLLEKLFTFLLDGLTD